MTNRTKVLFLFLAMLGAISVRAYAQQKTSEKISPKERWAFETNAMDWLLLLPNAKVEFDLSSSTDNRWVVGIGAKWNGNAKNQYERTHTDENQRLQTGSEKICQTFLYRKDGTVQDSQNSGVPTTGRSMPDTASCPEHGAKASPAICSMPD